MRAGFFCGVYAPVHIINGAIQTKLMGVVRHISGLFLAALGLLFAIGAIALVFDKESDLPVWMIGAMFVLLGLLPLAGAIHLLKRSTAAPPAFCPSCGNPEWAAAGVLTRPNSFWLMHLGGWLLASLWGASRKQQVRCVQCDHLYFAETRGTRIAGILLWVFVLMVLLGTMLDYFVRHTERY